MVGDDDNEENRRGINLIGMLDNIIEELANRQGDKFESTTS